MDDAAIKIGLPIIASPYTKPIASVDVFTNLYNQLNSEQKEAVDTIEGPVMVVAGPGTGKTQVLTLRIANILRKTQMNPRNILALTFTDSAAQNMRGRLISIVGPAAYGVGIYTFHGFANLVITEFPYKFQFAKELRSIDETEQIEIVEKLIDSLELIELRPPRAPYFYTRELMSRIGDLKKEAVTPARLRDLVRSEEERLTNDPANIHAKGVHKGKMKAAIVEELKHLARCKELADIYEGYENTLLKRGLYDYEDMVLFVVNALRDDFELKAYYQERFQYLLVDEYQDTNSSQNRLIEQLTDFFEEPNLFIVGDDKQSIFRFQGASMANLILFYKRYPAMPVISLTQNYRSPQLILDMSHALMGNALERITKEIEAVKDELVSNTKTDNDGPSSISLAVLKNTDMEEYFVVKKVKELIETGSAPAEIAIIYKENREAEGYANLLGRLGVPYTLQRGSDVLVDKDVRRLLTMLRAIDAPTDSRLLFEILHFDFTAVNGLDLLRLMSFRAKSHLSLLDSLDNLDEAKLSEPEKIKALYEKIGQWRQASANLSMPELLEKILEESGLLAQISASSDRIERFHRLRRFFDEIKRMALQTTGLTLEEMLRRIDLLISNSLQLVPEPLDTEMAGSAIHLLTAHRAKGLEFTHVFIPNLINKHWGNSNRRTLIKLPPSIIGQYRPLPDEKNEDERRLLYVAMTRAKQSLYLSYAKSKDGKEQAPSQFLSELGEAITPLNTANFEKEGGRHLLALFTPMTDSIFNDQEAKFLRQMIKDQPITPTALNNYLRCPKGYLYKNLLRVPTAKTAQQGYGTAIHTAMQAFFLRHKATKQVPSLDELLTSFQTALSKEILSAKELADFDKLGRSVLTKYYEKNLRAVTPTVAVEYSFDPHHVTIDSPDGPIFISGRLDKVELLDPSSNSVRVIDYKTGRARSRNEIEGKTASADEDYKRQLIFYQLLANTDRQFPYKVSETGLAFVDDNCRFPTELFTITKDEVNDLKQLIQNIYKQILSLEFPHFEDPKRPPCEFCNL